MCCEIKNSFLFNKYSFILYCHMTAIPKNNLFNILNTTRHNIDLLQSAFDNFNLSNILQSAFDNFNLSNIHFKILRNCLFKFCTLKIE